MQDGMSNQLALRTRTYNGKNYDSIINSEYHKTCLAELRSTYPYHDKIRIEQEKGGLLKDAYRWILETNEFKSFCDMEGDHRLFWINGDPGKGKTMLICGIIDELEPSTKQDAVETSDISLSYFFCQAHISGLNNATAVLKGLLHMLMTQQPRLIRHCYDERGLEIENWDSGAVIQHVFAKVLADPHLQNTYLIVDALEDCLTDLPVLLEFIVTSESSPVKWIVSSRNEDRIRKAFSHADGKLSLSLEIKWQQVSQAVDSYIKDRVRRLWVKKIKQDSLERIQIFLSDHSDGTFLQVAPVCERLKRLRSWEILRLFEQGKLMDAESPAMTIQW